MGSRLSDLRRVLYTAVHHGKIEGNESEIIEALKSIDFNDWKFISNEPHFSEMIAAVWRNKDVMSRVGQLKLSTSELFEILRHVELTPAESADIVSSVMGRVDDKCQNDLSAIRGIFYNHPEIFTASADEVWKTVFAHN